MSTIKENIAKLVRLYTEEESLGEQIKEIKEDIKASGGEPAIASAVAKAVVKGKIDELREKSNTTLDLIEVTRS